MGPDYTGVENVLCEPRCDVKIFGKQEARVNRRMGVVVAWDEMGTDPAVIKDRARQLADRITVVKKV